MKNSFLLELVNILDRYYYGSDKYASKLLNNRLRELDRKTSFNTELADIVLEASAVLRRTADPHLFITVMHPKQEILSASVYWCGEELVLSHHKDESTSDIQHRIVGVNSLSINELLDVYLSLYESCSKGMIKSFIVEDLLTCKFNSNGITTFEVVSDRGDSEYVEASSVSVFSILKTGFSASVPGSLTTVQSENLRSKNCHYIRLRGFKEKAGFNSISEKSVIIDVRRNKGGYVSDAIDALAQLLPKPHTITDYYVMDGRDLTPYSIHIPISHERMLDEKRVILLIDELTASSAEYIFVVSLSKACNATLVGQETAGTPGQAKQFAIGNGIGMLSVTTKRYFDTQLKRELQKGVMPDYQVETSSEDMLGGQDAAFNFALSLLP